MNLFFRLLILYLKTRFASGRTDFFETHTLNYRVWITDQDLFQHMNNGRYLSIMDLALVHWMMRTGTWAGIRANDWMPLAAYKDISFVRMLKFPQAYTVETTLMGWQDSYIILKHDFMSRGKLIAEASTIGRLASAKGDKPTIQTVIDSLGLTGLESPPLPEAFSRRLETLENARERGRSPKRETP